MKRLAIHITLLLCAVALGACRSAVDVAGLRTQLMNKPESYELKITGNSAFLRGTLQTVAAEDLRDFEQRDFARAAADDAAYAIETFYRSRGFPDSRVTYALERGEGQPPRLTLTVEEGPRCVIEEISFEGVRAFAQKDLAKLVTGPTTSVFGLGELYFVESALDSARSSAEDLYWENGYLDVSVDAPQVEFNAERTRAKISYVVLEGQQYKLREVRFSELQGEELQIATRNVQRFLGQPYFPRLAFEVRSTASEYFTRNGYPDCYAEATELRDAQDGGVELEVLVHRGDLVRISELRISGNERTREGFIRDRIELAPGDLYDRRSERRAFSELYATGLFNSITIDLVGSGNSRALEVRVVEAASLSLTGEIGYGSFERARVIVGITEENLAGTGRTLRLEAKLAQRAESVRMFLTDPWTLGKNNILGFTTFYDKREEPSFDRQDIGVGVNLTRPRTPRHRNVYGYEYRLSDAESINVASLASTIEDGGNAYISALYVTSIYESRDSLFLPTRGTGARVRLEVAPKEIASQLNFTRLEGRIASYHALNEQTLLAWTVQTGLIFPIQDTVDIPLQERYFSGGQNTVRSFRESELGPKDINGNPIGGETYSVASLELRRKLPGNFTGALFADAGNVSFETGTYLEFRDIRYAVGPGLRWLLPIGPLRLDWGLNPSPRQDEANWVLQFSVGVAF